MYDRLTLEAIAGIHSAGRPRRAEAMAAATPIASAKPTAGPGRYVLALLIGGFGYAALNRLLQAL